MSKPEKSVESIPESPQKTPKPYFFVMKVCHRRTDEIIAKRCGVVFALVFLTRPRSLWLQVWKRLQLCIGSVGNPGGGYELHRIQKRDSLG